uniref:PID domain-containing protein n=1 Tax=Strigamia maritima TaxID=126957 RepID=T1J3F3_STRMM
EEENNLLGFSNPNYHLDDAVNCNTSNEHVIYDELYDELDSVCNFRRETTVKNRRGYANLDLNSMGIDLATGPTTTAIKNPPSTLQDSNSNRDVDTSNITTTGLFDDNNRRIHQENENMVNCNGLLNDYYLTNQRNRTSDLLDIEDRGMDINSPDSNDSGIQAPLLPGENRQLPSDIFGIQTRSTASSTPSEPPSDDKTTPICEIPKETALPPGWEKHEDGDGPYYWHIKSGTIQRDPPPPAAGDSKEYMRSASISNDPISPVSNNSTSSVTTSEITSPKMENVESQLELCPRQSGEKDKPIRFAVRSLGWVEIAEDDLTPERSSKAVNKCIVDLSLGRNDILDAVGRWGDGKDLFMDLDDTSLKLVDPENLTVLNTQPIHTIRVWGVGRDNGRDFAYVARDRASRKHMCHVFRCDTPARTIANTLRDICKRIMLERTMTQSLARPLEGATNNCTEPGPRNTVGIGIGRTGLPRPTNLPTEHRRFHHRIPHTTNTAQSFPTPMEEPKKILKVRYAGVVQVPRPTGMDMLNQAVDQLTLASPLEQWRHVNVAVAPSTITIIEQGEEGKLFAECRVRYLSFLGIGKNVKHCAFIMRTAQEQFMAHVFYCEPSSGALCKTIEAACKLRYQKCLDAHREELEQRGLELQNNKGIGAAFKNMLGSLAGRKMPSRSAES